MFQLFGKVQFWGKLFNLPRSQTSYLLIANLIVDIPSSPYDPLVVIIAPKMLHSRQKSIHVIVLQLLHFAKLALQNLSQNTDYLLDYCSTAQLFQLTKNSNEVAVFLENSHHSFLAPRSQKWVSFDETLRKSLLSDARRFWLKTENISILENWLFFELFDETVLEKCHYCTAKKTGIVAIELSVQTGFEMNPLVDTGRKGREGRKLHWVRGESTIGEDSARLVLHLDVR
jgi:hypothetical protein